MLGIATLVRDSLPPDIEFCIFWTYAPMELVQCALKEQLQQLLHEMV
uniref:Uncharacterized protein n=1 Tax=Anguilla anguilla TaxID=7936 RepID=A0A0E9QBM3_ANGAN